MMWLCKHRHTQAQAENKISHRVGEECVMCHTHIRCSAISGWTLPFTTHCGVRKSVHRHTDITAFVSISKTTFCHNDKHTHTHTHAAGMVKTIAAALSLLVTTLHSVMHLSNAPGLKPIFKLLLFSNVPCALHLIYHFLFLTLFCFSFPAWFRCLLPLGSPFSLCETLLLRLHVCTQNSTMMHSRASARLSLRLCLSKFSFAFMSF